MKSSSDPRHMKRINSMQQLFSVSFENGMPDKPIGPITQHLTAIDEKITDAAPEWPINQIAKIDLAILRLACFELMITKKEPPKVLIDEAIELAKSFGNPNSPQFVNGVLGSIYKTL